MRLRQTTFNPKRRLLETDAAQAHRAALGGFARHARYAGNPEHKSSPGDFGLTPPASPRRGKSQCDDVTIHQRQAALELLRAGLRLGMVDARGPMDDWPGMVWAVTVTGFPLEAQHEGSGRYHGYPMPQVDVFREHVLLAWRQRCPTA